MQTILEKTEFSQQDIQQIIDAETEESINIEFKDAKGTELRRWKGNF